MKKLSVIAIITAAILGIIFFDQIIVFLLSGFIPGTNFTIPATTMLAVIVASTILIIALKRRHAVYRNCLELYDELFYLKQKQDDNPTADSKSKLPRRRYQEL